MRLKPGKGWVPTDSPAVWVHSSGVRVHMLGMVFLPDGTCFNESRWPFMVQANRAMKMQGGNRRRGLMAWAAEIIRRGPITEVEAEAEAYLRRANSYNVGTEKKEAPKNRG